MKDRKWEGLTLPTINRNGWPDSTTGNTNLLYLRSNGWLQPGWFGSIEMGTKNGFNPGTGAVDPSATLQTSTDAALTGLLFAVSRGDAAFVSANSGFAYLGLVASPPP